MSKLNVVIKDGECTKLEVEGHPICASSAQLHLDARGLFKMMVKIPVFDANISIDDCEVEGLPEVVTVEKAMENINLFLDEKLFHLKIMIHEAADNARKEVGMDTFTKEAFAWFALRSALFKQKRFYRSVFELGLIADPALALAAASPLTESVRRKDKIRHYAKELDRVDDVLGRRFTPPKRMGDEDVDHD
jgi:hypothetical protein